MSVDKIIQNPVFHYNILRIMAAVYSIEHKVTCTIVAKAITYNNCEKSVRMIRKLYGIEPPSTRTVRIN